MRLLKHMSKTEKDLTVIKHYLLKPTVNTFLSFILVKKKRKFENRVYQSDKQDSVLMKKVQIGRTSLF